MRLAPFTSAAIAEAGQPVKHGAGQDRAGCFRAGQAGNDALTDHEPPGEQVASHVGAGRPHTPPDLRERRQLRSFSKGFAVPIENDYICGTVVLLRQEDGRLRAQRVDCRVKACPKCGPRLRAEWAKLWTQVFAGEVLYRWVGPDAEWSKLQRRKVMAGHQYGVIPGPGGTRVVYTTAPIGPEVKVLTLSLTSDFAAVPNDSRQRSLSAGWQRRADCVEAFTGQASGDAPPRKLEYVGILRAGLEHARQLAREFGVYEEEAGVDGSAFIFRQPENPLAWSRFKRWAGLEKPPQRWPRRRRKAAA